MQFEHKNLLLIPILIFVLSEVGFTATSDDQSSESRASDAVVYTDKQAPAKRTGYYTKKEILDARYGGSQIGAQLAAANQIATRINQRVRGQEAVASLLETRVIQYLEGFGERTKEPIHVNLIGLPGVGKSSIVEILMNLGISFAFVDAQHFTDRSADLGNAIVAKVVNSNRENTPLILFVEEVDKIPEIIDGREVSNAAIGTLNQILSDGRFTARGDLVPASNILVITTMNFSPVEIETFSKEFLNNEKSFYDFTVDDMEKFSQWLNTQTNAKYKILSKLFRSNTVRRFAPFTMVMSPLTRKVYRQIVEDVVRNSIRRNVKSSGSKRRIEVTYDDSLIEFLVKETVYPPSGAGETVLRSDALVEQLISFGIKARSGDDETLARPRKIHLSMDLEKSMARIEVSSEKFVLRGLLPDANFSITASFEASTGLFIRPTIEEVLTLRPELDAYKASRRTSRPTHLTKKQIIAYRYPEVRDQAKGLSDYLNSQIRGQDAISKVLENEMNKYLSLKKEVAREPAKVVLAGFPGLGKSEAALLTAKFLKIPVVKINLQQFASKDSQATAEFLATLVREIYRARSLYREMHPRATGEPKFILLLDEMDKLFEIDGKGEVVERPIIGSLKELFATGRFSYTNKEGEGTHQFEVDIRSAFTFVTMNFIVDRFGFTADPRMTTLDDVRKAWARITKTTASLKELLGSMFLPDTVNRIITSFYVYKPLDQKNFEDVIRDQLGPIEKLLFQNERGVNLAQAKVELSSRYLQFLIDETIIPSEGARHTALTSRSIIETDIRLAMSKLPRSKFGSDPILIALDYLPSKKVTIAKVKRQDASSADKPVILFERDVILNFPRLAVRGRLQKERLKTSAHELGHALIGSILGLRFERVVVVSTNPSAGGFVSFREKMSSASEKLAFLYAGVASRAAERIAMFDDPRSELAVMGVTTGPSMDIKMVTANLYHMLYEWGFDPWGGTMSTVMSQYVQKDGIPDERIQKLGRIIRRLENFLVDEMLSFRSQEWFVDKVAQLARAGEMLEPDFYKLVGFELPTTKEDHYTSDSYIETKFSEHIIQEKAGVLKARQQKRGKNGESSQDFVRRYTDQFLQILKEELHPEIDQLANGRRSNEVVQSCRKIF